LSRKHARIQRIAKRVYRTLDLDGSARIVFASPPTARPISSKPSPIPKSQERGVRDAAGNVCLAYPDLLPPAFWPLE